MTTATHTHDSNGAETSSSESCLFCGRTKYCFHIKDDLGEIIKIICDRTDAQNPLEGWSYAGIAKDGRNTFVKNGYKFRKKRGKKYPEVIELSYQPKSNCPQWQDVHIPVEQVERGHAVLIKPEVGLGLPETVYQVKDLKSGKRQGNNVLLAILTVQDLPYGGTVEIAASDIAEVLTHDPVTGAKEQFIEYYYSDDLKVVRHQWTDRRAVYGGKTKQIRPYYRTSDGTWILGKGDNQWPLYGQSAAVEAIRAGKIVVAVGGEESVLSLCSIGLTAVCNQGGENSYQQIAESLAPSFKEAAEFQQLLEVDAEDGLEAADLKPLLVIWPDNDDTGRKTFGEGLPKECYKNGVIAVAINPLTLWSDMPLGGDAKDWVDNYCWSGDIPKDLSTDEGQQRWAEEIKLRWYRPLEFAIDEAIDQQEEELRLRWQREAWDAPTSHKGEIGRWVQKGEGEKAKKEWKPLCNFDFQVERELEDSTGGGLVLQIKRSFEQRQHRIILKSTDYTKVDKFVDSLKAGLRIGVVCNLKSNELGALIHSRLHEYRTNRQGKVYKRIDRYGQQPDGTWVFGDRQYTPGGQPTSEAETGWVFSNVSSEGDEIPCPELAPENPKALKGLVNAARQFFGHENFHQVILLMGWVVAGIHSQVIFKEKRWFPLINAHGEPGSCKTLAGEAALSLVGVNWAEKGMLARSSPSAIYEHGSRTGALPFIWDDPDRNPQNEEIAKTWANWKARVVRYNRQEPHSPMGLTSNHVFGGDQAATYSRLIRLPFERAKGGNNESFQELQAAQKLASGAFPTLLQIGYSVEAIAAIERELLNHLPKAHARIAQALAMVVYYAQKVVGLAEGTEDIKQWVINYLCPGEDDADSAGDSLQDFIAKVLSLESESLVGDWNKRAVTTADGRDYIALHYADVWSLVDKHYKPATYNLKALKPLVVKAGGRVDNCAQKFDTSRDETLAYHRACLSPRTDEEGSMIEPNPPRKSGRKSWLLPIDLFDSSDGDGGGDGGTNPNPTPPEPTPDNEESAPVTTGYQELPDFGNRHNLDEASNSATDKDQVTKLPIFNDEIEIEIESSDAAGGSHASKSISGENLVTLVTQPEIQPEIQSASQFQEVTSFGNSAGNSLVTDNAEQASAHTQAPTPALQLASLLKQCPCWAEVEQATERDAQKLRAATHQMSNDERQGLTTLPAAHLQQHPPAIDSLDWLLPHLSKLRDRALERLTYTVIRIEGQSLHDAHVERVSGCKFVAVPNPPATTAWIFQLPDGTNIYTGNFEIEEVAA